MRYFTTLLSVTAAGALFVGLIGPDTTAGVGAGDCAQVDVWIPESMAKADSAPTLNDPNASITLDITPSKSETSACSLLKYHYLRKGQEAPALPPNTSRDL